MKKRISEDNIFLLGMVLSMTCWGFSWASGKVLSGYGAPLTIAFLRFVVTVISLVFILLVMKEKFTISKKGLVDVALAAVFLSFYNYCFFKGLTVGKAGAGGVLVTVLNPIIAYGVTLGLARRKPSQSEFLGLGLGLIAGVVLLKVITDPSNVFSTGNIYFLFAAISWAVLSRFTARATRYGSSLSFSFWLYSISTLILLAVCDWGAVASTLQKGDLIFWSNLIFSATITTSLATTFYFIATAKIGASKASSFIFMVPFSAALGSWMFLGEVIEIHTIIGGLLGIGAVYILNRKR
jgi:drug/metabolite transporter (DMT)-like permease